MHTEIEVYAVIHFTVFGLSHVLQPRAWAEFFVWLRGLGRPGVFCNAALHFLFGSLIVSFHPVWTGLPMVLTVLGCGFTCKGALYFCAPAIGARSMARVSLENSRGFIVAGVVMLALAALVAYVLVRAA